MKLRRISLACALALPLASGAAFAQPPTSLQLDSIFAPLTDGKSPGLAVLVRQDGRTVFQRGYGVRDLRTLRKIDGVTDFRLASFTKQFTAMAVMLLAHDGKLRYDQPLTEIFPDFPAYAHAITLRHLLTHTSGLPDYEDVMDARLWTPEHQIQDEDTLALLERQTTPQFAPGTSWAYSNSAYVLLGLIVAKVSGEPFGQFLEDRIFKPLHMTGTLAYRNGRNTVPQRAYGYSRKAAKFVETDQSSTSATLGDGGVYSNLADLAEWDAAGGHVHHRGVAGHLDLFPLGYRARLRAADPRRRGISGQGRIKKSREDTMQTRRNFLATAAAAGMAYPMGARADYADRPIHIIVGYAAGGGVDIAARLLSEPMKATLGQSIIVENRTGASAMIASNTVAKAAPDGYTLLMAASGEVAINQFLFKDKMIYDARRELTPVALIGIVPCVVVVATSTPVHNPQELIAYAKANAGKLSFSSSGVGNPQQLAGELMNSMAGINVLHVPYRGSAPAVTDVATGAVTMSFSSLAAVLPLISADKLRAVAVTSKDRMPQLPDVAPLSEGAPGLARYELLNWFGMFATAGTPGAIVDRLNDIVNTAVITPAASDKLIAQGIVPRLMTAKEYASFVESETQKFGMIVQQAHIKLEN